MKFKYSKFLAKPSEAFPDLKEVWRPVVPIKIINRDKEFGYLALVDSGADFCIFHTEAAEILGIPVNNGKKLRFYGTSGTSQRAYFHTIQIEVAGWPMELYCGFSDDMKSLPYGLLGQTGFFDRFRIEFDYQNKRIELKPKR
mgnify:CR=1 FL=1